MKENGMDRDVSKCQVGDQVCYEEFHMGTRIRFRRGQVIGVGKKTLKVMFENYGEADTFNLQTGRRWGASAYERGSIMRIVDEAAYLVYEEKNIAEERRRIKINELRSCLDQRSNIDKLTDDELDLFLVAMKR